MSSSSVRTVLRTSLVIVGLIAIAPASAQPNPGLGTCGSDGIPFPTVLGGGCRWQCTKTLVGARKDRPPHAEYHWRKVCPPKVWREPGGKAEIKKKNVPTVKPNKQPND